ncbi:MAG TPA: hypothetical protein VJB05_03900 [archaeon]|nr:hypothetical protein [archaeon]
MKYFQKFLLWIVLLIIVGAVAIYFSSLVIAPFIVVSFLLLVPRDLLKSPRMLIWAFFIILSVLLIGVNLHPAGLSVTAVGKNSTIRDIAVGEIIYKINDVDVTSAIMEKSYIGTIKIETNKGSKFEFVNGTLGLETDAVQTTNLKFGLDIKGGVRAVLEPNTTDNATIDQIVSTLQTRINIYGLRESVFRPIYHEGKGFVEISIAGGSKEELRNLLENQGKFEAKITINPKMTSGTGVIRLSKNYDFSVNSNVLTIDNKQFREGDTLELDGISFLLVGITQNKLNMTATVFGSEDIKTVFFDPQRSRVERLEEGFQWSFAVQIGPSGAQKFAWVTNNLEIVPGTGYLNNPIVLYLDNNLVDSLSISSGLKGKAETEISISGVADTMELATKERSRLQSILRSGALPTSVTIVQLETISPNLGPGFLKNAMLAGLAAILGIVIVVSIRYRKVKIVLPMLAISLSEVLIILGIATVIGWTIDLPAIAGIIASVGTGIDSQIMIIDQALRGEVKTQTLKEKIGRAFFVIFGSAGTIIAAMIPLMAIGFGLLRGFAITTIIGVLVGVLIARPAYGVIIKRMVKE